MKRTFADVVRTFVFPIKTDIFGWFRTFFSNFLAHTTVALPVVCLSLIQKYQSLLTSDTLWGLVIIFIFIESFLWFFRDDWFARPAYTWYRSIMRYILPKFIRLSNASTEKTGTGRIINAIDQGTDKWEQMIFMATNFLAQCTVLAITTFIVLKQYGIMTIVAFLGCFIIFSALIIWFNHFTLEIRKKRKMVDGELTRGIVKISMSKFEILQNKKIQQEIQSIESLSYQGQKLAHDQVQFQTVIYELPRSILGISMIAILWIFIDQTLKIKLNILEATTLLGLVVLFQSNSEKMMDFVKDFTKEFVHVERLWDLIESEDIMEGYDTGNIFKYKKGNYEFKNLTFAYKKIPVLKNFSLTLQGGKKTALVGKSGGGKTTLMKLLAGYMRPTSGDLMIDGQDITSIRLDSYYPHIGYLTQEPSVFDGTIEENLLYGAREKPSQKDIKRAIELAECQFIYELEHGIKTEIGERGVRLSGGQKQRLAIAKIFLKDPEIILLDEPTAALDSYSEEKVARAFEHLFEGRTVIVIAHRLQTVKSADDIIVLEKGKIVERGTHTQLLKLGKKYAGMVDLQSGIVKENDE